jgi:putative transport protein
MAAFAQILRDHPELAVFLTLALGFQAGKLRVGTFTLGNVLGCLLAGVLVGQLDVPVSPTVKAIFFGLFLFATGYKVGPQFFRGLRKDGLPQLALAVVVAVLCLVTAVVVSRLFGYDAGTAAGLLAGAFTESTIIGTATEAIQNLPLPEAERMRMAHQVPVAYAVTYLVGTSTLVYYLSNLAPKLMRIDLRKAARELEVQVAGKVAPEPGVGSAYYEWAVRAIRLERLGAAGRTVADVESQVEGRRFFVERVRRHGVVRDAHPGMVLHDGDVVATVAQREIMLEKVAALGEEVHDRELLDFPTAVLDVVVTAKGIEGRTIGELARERGRGIALQRIVRAGQEIPFTGTTVLQRGDLLQLSGRQGDVERAAATLGYVDRPSAATDMVFVGLGIFLGGLVGLLHVRIGGVAITLTTSGGALVLGLVFGWLRSVRPTFGRIPEGGLWIFDTLGLCAFIGIVGLGAGPSFVHSIRQTGPSLILAGLIVSLVPHTMGLLFGRYVLKMNPVILLGAEAGSGTNTAALRAVQDAAQSKLPVLGYTIPYAVGNILLTAWGPVIVALMT